MAAVFVTGFERYLHAALETGDAVAAIFIAFCGSIVLQDAIATARQQRLVNPALLTVEIFYSSPQFELGGNFQRQVLALVNPADRV